MAIDGISGGSVVQQSDLRQLNDLAEQNALKEDDVERRDERDDAVNADSSDISMERKEPGALLDVLA